MSRISPPASRRPLTAVFAIALGSFSVVVAEFVPVGALSQISDGLAISEGTAGLLVTLPALVGAVAAPVATVLIRRLDRRAAIIGLTALIIISGILSVVAPNFAFLLASRALLGISVGGIWAVAVSAASQLVPEKIAHTASSMVFGAIAIGSVVTVPSATLIAAHTDWRWAFAASAAVAAISVIVQLVLIPPIPAAGRVLLSDFRTLVSSGSAVAILAIVLLTVFAQFSAFTYVVPFLERVSELGATSVSLLVLVYGALTVVGNFGGGALLGRSVRGTAMATLVAGTAGLAVLAIGGSVLVAAIVGLVLWGLAWGNIPVALQHWLYTFGRGKFSTEAVNATFTAVVQVGVAAGSFFSGVAVDAAGIRSSAVLGSSAMTLALLVGAVLIVATRPRRPRYVPDWQPIQ